MEQEIAREVSGTRTSLKHLQYLIEAVDDVASKVSVASSTSTSKARKSSKMWWYRLPRTSSSNRRRFLNSSTRRSRYRNGRSRHEAHAKRDERNRTRRKVGKCVFQSSSSTTLSSCIREVEDASHAFLTSWWCKNF